MTIKELYLKYKYQQNKEVDINDVFINEFGPRFQEWSAEVKLKYIDDIQNCKVS